jgi:hypothetical protein
MEPTQNKRTLAGGVALGAALALILFLSCLLHWRVRRWRFALEQAGSIFIHDYLSNFVLHFTAPLISLAAGVVSVLRFQEDVQTEILIRDKFCSE